MKILQVHNYYQQAGGEDVVVATERAVLEQAGHEVLPYTCSNDDIPVAVDGDWRSRCRAFWRLLRVSGQTIWNHGRYREMRKRLRDDQPDVVHVHNFFPRLSPSIFWACAAERVPVVMTLHNYRLLCLNSCLFKTQPDPALSNTSAHICERCLTKSFKWPGIRFRCYRGSRAGSATVALMCAVHRWMGTWTRKIDRYVVLTEFQRQKFIEAGWPADKLHIKPNHVPTPEAKDRAAPSVPHPYALFVGRLAPEKGVERLLQAWARNRDCWSIKDGHPHLVVVGDGPAAAACRAEAVRLNIERQVTFLGVQSRDAVLQLMRQARSLVMPSLWYETFGLVVMEAGLMGVPSIVAAPGASAELVRDGETGICCDRWNVDAWAEKLQWIFEQPDSARQLGAKAKAEYQIQTDEQKALQAILAVYDL